MATDAELGQLRPAAFRRRLDAGADLRLEAVFVDDRRDHLGAVVEGDQRHHDRHLRDNELPGDRRRAATGHPRQPDDAAARLSGGFFPVVAEALAPGIGSIAGDSWIDLAASPTFQFLDRERRLLIQEDLLDADPAPPPELIEHYGARSANAGADRAERAARRNPLGVLTRPGPGEWAAEDVAVLEHASERVLNELG